MAVNPATLAIAGAGIGAMMDRDEPLRGAMIGGLGGFAGGTALGAQAGTAGAYSTMPGMTAATTGSAIPSQQAAMLAAQTGEFGVPGWLATSDAAAYTLPGNMVGKLSGFGHNLVNTNSLSTGKASDMMKAGQMMQSINQQPQRQQPMIAPTPMIRPPQGQINPVRPYDDEDYGFTTPYPSRLPSFGGF